MPETVAANVPLAPVSIDGRLSRLVVTMHFEFNYCNRCTDADYTEK